MGFNLLFGLLAGRLFHIGHGLALLAFVSLLFLSWAEKNCDLSRSENHCSKSDRYMYLSIANKTCTALCREPCNGPSIWDFPVKMCASVPVPLSTNGTLPNEHSDHHPNSVQIQQTDRSSHQIFLHRCHLYHLGPSLTVIWITSPALIVSCQTLHK